MWFRRDRFVGRGITFMLGWVFVLMVCSSVKFHRADARSRWTAYVRWKAACR